MSALPPVADITSLKGMSALCHKWTSCESSSKIKKPRLCLPGHLAFQMPRGRQFEYAPEKPSKSPVGASRALLRSRCLRDRSIGWDGEIAAYANDRHRHIFDAKGFNTCSYRRAGSRSPVLAALIIRYAMISGTADPKFPSDLQARSKASPIAKVAASSNQTFWIAMIFIGASRKA